LLLKFGNKSRSENTVRVGFSVLKKIKKQYPQPLFVSAIDIVKPFCEIKRIKISGTNHKVPVEVIPSRQKILGLRFLVANTIKRSERSITKRISNEISDTLSLSSQSVKNCDEIHKVAEVNKVYIQYRN
jgi:small subunit ribosomal protein S7